MIARSLDESPQRLATRGDQLAWEDPDRWRARHGSICRFSVVLGLALVISLAGNAVQWVTR
jgi:hypothetical protein